MHRTQARSKTRRRKEERDRSRLKQHAIRLVAREVLRCADEGQETHEARSAACRAAIDSASSSSDAAIPTQHNALSMTDPLDHHRTAGRIPDPHPGPERLCDRLEIASGG